jgi:hypothetical protein
VSFTLAVSFVLGLAGAIAHLQAIPMGGRDYVVFMQGIYRVQHGLIPHSDFYTPLGILNFALPAFISKSGLPTYTSLVMALGLTAAFLAVTCYAIFRPLSGWFALIASIAVFCFGFGFRALGEETAIFQRQYTIHLYYNRICFAAFILSAMIIYANALCSRYLSRLEQVALASCGFICLYTKISYAPILLGIASLWLCLVDRDLVKRSYTYFLFTFAGLHVPFVLLFGSDFIINYVWDIVAAAQASASFRKSTLLSSFGNVIDTFAHFNSVSELAFLSCSVLIAFSMWRQKTMQLPWYLCHWVFVSSISLLAIIYFSITNSGPIETSVLSLPVVLMLMAFICHRKPLSAKDRRVYSGFLIASIIVVFVQAETAWGAWSAMRYPGPRLLTMGGNLGSLSRTDKDFERYMESGEAILLDLKGHLEKTLLVFDLSDILSPALVIGSPKHVPLFFHYPIVWSDRCVASFESITSDVDVVLIPKRPLFPEETPMLVKYYGGYFNHFFDKTVDTIDWTRYDRKPQIRKSTAAPISRNYCARTTPSG